MKKILVVEDSRSLGRVLREELENAVGVKISVVTSYALAQRSLQQEKNDFCLALLDYHLPDAEKGEIIDLALESGVPSIVFTTDMSDETRSRIWAKGIVDYVLKEDKRSIEYIVYMVCRILQNTAVKVIVVDDSEEHRSELSTLMKTHMYQVFEAANGIEAMALLNDHPGVKMVLTDSAMPEMDGIALLKMIRSVYAKDELAVIGVTEDADPSLAARFIKVGANDFIRRPFLIEEFYSRITQNIEMLDIIQENKNASIVDYLTGLYNRRYFFQAGRKMLGTVKRGTWHAAVAMMDIDEFKDINDKYGHNAGDIVLRGIAEVLRERLRESDIICRFGGEEFCVLATNIEAGAAEELFEELREKISEKKFAYGDERIRVTVSIGVCGSPHEMLEDMIHEADDALYAAKRAGRNKVVAAPPSPPADNAC